MSDTTRAEPHSHEYFGEQRNYWWNADFIALLARRCELQRARTVLDVGCGLGHWSRLLLPHLSDDAQICGVDADASWTAQATKQAAHDGLSWRLRFLTSRVEALPFADDSFDIVTCQTLLIHVADVQAALTEMKRVLRPGGRICVVEPNNLSRSLANAHIVEPEHMETVLHLVRFQMVCEAGKKALGKGHNSVGECIPQMLCELDFAGIKVFLSDKAFTLLPPYAKASERAEIAQAEEWASREFWIWDRSETEAYFLAGGGEPGRFIFFWETAMREQRAWLKNSQQRRAYRAGGVISYIISGVKKG